MGLCYSFLPDSVVCSSERGNLFPERKSCGGDLGMNMRREVREDEWAPRGYAIAYYDLVRNQAIAYPLGLHWVVRGARSFYHWTMRYRRTSLENLLIEFKRQGYDKGYRDGFVEGVQATEQEVQRLREGKVQ